MKLLSDNTESDNVRRLRILFTDCEVSIILKSLRHTVAYRAGDNLCESLILDFLEGLDVEQE